MWPNSFLFKVLFQFNKFLFWNDFIFPSCFFLRMWSITGTVLSGPGGLEVQLTSSQLQLCGSSPENLRAAAEVIWEYSLIKWVSQNASGFYNFNVFFFPSTASVSTLMSEHLWVQTNTFLLFYFQKSHKKNITSIWLAQLCTKIKIEKFKKEKSQTFTLVAALKLTDEDLFNQVWKRHIVDLPGLPHSPAAGVSAAIHKI